MSLQIIKANPAIKRRAPQGVPYLKVSEFFCDTIQGENFVGWTAAFLRFQNCTMACEWCDTTSVWQYGNPYSFEELFELMDKADLPRKLHDGQHLVFTGGSPLKQEKSMVLFIEAFIAMYDFKPFIEIENECALLPGDKIIKYVDLWNNSPKLANSGNIPLIRYQPPILKKLSSLENSWFKFVISNEKDWDEIKEGYIDYGLIRKDQVVLMPEGATRIEIEQHREIVVDIAIRENVRYTTREHVILWDKATGV